MDTKSARELRNNLTDAERRLWQKLERRQIATVTLEAGMDLRGILGIDANVRNGFDGIKVHYEIDADASAEDIAALVAQSQKRSAVFDVIANPTDVTVTTSKT